METWQGRLDYLEKLFDLDEFERNYVRSILFSSLGRERGEEGQKWTEVQKKKQEQWHSYLQKKKVLMRFFLQNEEMLKKRILDYILKGDWEDNSLGITYYYPQEQSPMFYGKNPLYQVENAELVCLYGKKGTGRKSAVMQYEQSRQQVVAFIPQIVLTEEEENRILFEVILHQSVVCVPDYEENQRENQKLQYMLEMFREGTGRVYLIADGEELKKLPVLNCRQCDLHFSIPKRETAQELWRAYSRLYQIRIPMPIERLCENFQFTPAQIQSAVRWIAQRQDIPTEDNLVKSACLLQLEHNLGKKAKKIEGNFSWEDLILPKLQKRELMDACNQIRYKNQVYQQWDFQSKVSYGKGVSMLFCGAPGTGKTMAAEIVAKEVQQELYKINIPAIVSKYIGETEKNLDEIFTEAEKAQGILFFDEADVLFGKRTELKEANDKFNNMEASYLLQKMEEYDGTVILATNFKQNMDEAFQRRISFCIEFPFPDASYRKKMWLAAFPVKMPKEEDMDFEFLAEQFPLSGSNIKNCVRNAAFYAAAMGETQVEMKHVLRAVKKELGKSGKQIRKEELGEYYMHLEE